MFHLFSRVTPLHRMPLRDALACRKLAAMWSLAC